MSDQASSTILIDEGKPAAPGIATALPDGPRKLCALNIDLDPIDHYLSARSYEPRAVTNLNAVYDDALPRFLDIFDRYGAKATFFIVGKDAACPANRSRIREIVTRGHEVANHTYSHSQRFQSLSAEEQRREIDRAGKQIEDVAQTRVIGFRAPGWGMSEHTLDILEALDYRYDSSVFPSRLLTVIASINWLLNRGRLARTLGGSHEVGAAPKLPYHPARGALWKRGARRILELPMAVLPGVELPFLGTVVFLLGSGFFSTSVRYLALFNRPVVYGLHGIELVDYDRQIQDERLAVKPGLRTPVQDKLRLYDVMLTEFQRRYRFVTMRQLADTCGGPGG